MKRIIATFLSVSMIIGSFAFSVLADTGDESIQVDVSAMGLDDDEDKTSDDYKLDWSDDYVDPLKTTLEAADEDIDVDDQSNDNAGVANSFTIENGVLTDYTGTGGAVTIPSNVVEIGRRAFSGEGGVTSVTIPSSVKKIDAYAFSGCYGITTLYLSEGLVEIENDAFYGCSAIRKLTLPNSLTSIGYEAFQDCTTIMSVKFGTNLRTIGSDAFRGNTALTTITWNSNIQSIGPDAFRDTALEKLNLPASVTYLGDRAFAYNYSLTSVKINGNLSTIPTSCFYKCKSLSSLDLGTKVSVIENYAFEECASLTTVTIPNSVEKINYEAFYNCAALTKVTFGTNLVYIGGCAFKDDISLSTIVWGKNLVTIDYEAFRSTALSSLSIPNSVTTLGTDAFRNCDSMTSVVVGTGVTALSDNCFRDCDSLTKVTINGCVTIIGQSTFNHCDQLISINIPDSVTKIGNYCFEECVSLKAIRLGNGVTHIGYYAFSKCSSLKTIYLPYYLSTWGGDVFSQINNNVTAYVYKGTKSVTFAQEMGINFKYLAFKPNAVTGLRAVSAGKKMVRLYWNESAGADGYLIYAQKNGKYGYVGLMTSGLSYLDTKALDTDYNYYWVFPFVYNESGKMVVGGTSNYVYAKGICAAVTNLKATAQSGSIKLTWTKSPSAEGYLIYGIPNGTGKYQYLGMTTGTSFTHKNASKTQYSFYWVFPYHKDAKGNMITGLVNRYTYGKAK